MYVDFVFLQTELSTHCAMDPNPKYVTAVEKEDRELSKEEESKMAHSRK